MGRGATGESGRRSEGRASVSLVLGWGAFRCAPQRFQKLLYLCQLTSLCWEQAGMAECGGFVIHDLIVPHRRRT